MLGLVLTAGGARGAPGGRAETARRAPLAARSPFPRRDRRRSAWVVYPAAERRSFPIDMASEQGWIIVDMKRDWKVVFPAERP